MIRLFALLFLLATSAVAEEIVSDLSRDEVSITTTFDGSDILVFGAVRRDAPEPDGTLGVIVTVAGPETEVVVRRKERKFGIWVNSDEVKIEAAPSFYAVATSGTLAEVLSESADNEARISIPQAVGDGGNNVQNSVNFEEALIRIRGSEDLYQFRENSVDVSQNTLFSTSIELPANLTEGDYVTRIFLTRDGAIIDSYDTAIPVKKVGLERWLYNMSRNHAFWYGIMSLAIAIAAGWLASAAFGLLRR